MRFARSRCSRLAAIARSRSSGIVRDETFPEGAVLVREGDPAGDFLGEISLIDGRPRTATVTADQPIEALVVGRSGFARLMDEFPVIRFDLVTALTERVRAREPESTD